MSKSVGIIVFLLLFALAGCNNGGSKDGGSPGDAVNVRDVIVNPATPGTTSLVEVTIDASATGTPVSDRMKLYTASGGTLYETTPDFTMVLRGISQTGGAASLTTKQNKIYWVTPASPGEFTLSAAIGDRSAQKRIVIGNSAATMSVTTDAQGRKVVSVSASGVTNLFQAAFRINYQQSKYTCVAVEKGDFLGSDVLFIGEKDKTPVGVVAVSLTRKRGQGGVSGTGVLARVIFEEKKAASADREPSRTSAFDFEYVTLLDADGRPIGT